MKSMRIMRINPSITHNITTKHTKATLFKNLRKLYTRKANIHGLFYTVIHSRIRNKRRSYYHDNRYSDPWSNTKESLVRYQEVPYGNRDHIKRDKDLLNYVNKLENLRWNQRIQMNTLIRMKQP